MILLENFYHENTNFVLTLSKIVYLNWAREIKLLQVK